MNVLCEQTSVAMDVALILLMDISVTATQDIKRASLKCVKASHRFTLYLYYLKTLFCLLCYTGTGWSKIHTIYSWYMVYLPKNKLHWNHKIKLQRYVKCWKCPMSSVMRAFTLFLSFHATQWSVSVVFGNSSPD
jgi:hypothetical protein